MSAGGRRGESYGQHQFSIHRVVRVYVWRVAELTYIESTDQGQGKSRHGTLPTLPDYAVAYVRTTVTNVQLILILLKNIRYDNYTNNIKQ